jgi:hypothetical protein
MDIKEEYWYNFFVDLAVQQSIKDSRSLKDLLLIQWIKGLKELSDESRNHLIKDLSEIDWDNMD